MCNQALVDVEIESLGDMFNACRNDKQAWLASTNKRNENIALSKVIEKKWKMKIFWKAWINFFEKNLKKKTENFKKIEKFE